MARFIYANGSASRALVEQRLAQEIASQAEHGISYWPTGLQHPSYLLSRSDLE